MVQKYIAKVQQGKKPVINVQKCVYIIQDTTNDNVLE